MMMPRSQMGFNSFAQQSMIPAYVMPGQLAGGEPEEFMDNQ
jgi:hypothetical protein